MSIYSINQISKPVLITPDECTAKLTNSSLDSKKWISAIELAEIRFVIPVLGYALYNDICNQKNILVDSGNQAALQTLINQTQGVTSLGAPKVPISIGMLVNSIGLVTVNPAYVSLWNTALWNFVYNCVYFIALSENYAQFSSAGIVKNNPEGSVIGEKSTSSVGIDLRDLRYLNDRWLLDRISPLQDYLEQFLCANISTLPLYPSYKCLERNKHNEKRTTEFINIYEDDDCYYRKDNFIPSSPMPTPTPVPYKLTCTINIEIKDNPDNSLLYQLCNLQTIPKQYQPSAQTLEPGSMYGDYITLPNLIGKYVNSAGMTKNGNSIVIPFDSVTGRFGSFGTGWFNGQGEGDIFQFLYAETM